MNKTILIGRLVKDPELKFTANTGTATCRFTLAVNRRKQKDKEQEADFIGCLAFGKTAETIAEYLVKGRQVAIDGSLRTGSYTDKDGVKRYTTDVIVSGFEFIGNKQEGNTSTGAPFSDAGSFGDDMTPVNDGEMPF